MHGFLCCRMWLLVGELGSQFWASIIQLDSFILFSLHVYIKFFKIMNLLRDHCVTDTNLHLFANNFVTC